MIIFVDESGIHKQTGHSTFALAYVSVKDYVAFEKAFLAIEEKYRIKYFHWTRHSWGMRENFFREILKLSFSVKVAVFKNPVRSNEALTWALLHLLAAEKRLTRIEIDGEKPRWVERQTKKTLRDAGISVRKLSTVRYTASAGVRLADAFAGLSRSYYDEPNGRAQKLWGYAQKRITTQLLGGQGDG